VGSPPSLEAIGHPAFGQVVRGHLDQDTVASQNADAVFAHLSSGVADDFVIVFKFDAECRIGQQFNDCALKL
jgi:hypothetical protein